MWVYTEANSDLITAKKKLSQASNLYNIPYFVSFDLHYYFQLDQEDSAYLGRKKGKTFQYL